MKQVASPGLMHNTGCLGLVHWDDPEEWYGEGGGGSGWGTCVYLWQIHVDIWQNQYNIVKFKKKKRTKRLLLIYQPLSLSRLLDTQNPTWDIQLADHGPVVSVLATSSEL